MLVPVVSMQLIREYRYGHNGHTDAHKDSKQEQPNGILPLQLRIFLLVIRGAIHNPLSTIQEIAAGVLSDRAKVFVDSEQLIVLADSVCSAE